MAEHEPLSSDYVGLGEYPSPEVPGVIQISTPGLTDAGFETALSEEGGKVAKKIRDLHEAGKTVIADLTPGRVTLWVSQHKRTIEASAAASLVVGTSVTVYLLRNRKKNK